MGPRETAARRSKGRKRFCERRVARNEIVSVTGRLLNQGWANQTSQRDDDDDAHAEDGQAVAQQSPPCISPQRCAYHYLARHDLGEILFGDSILRTDMKLGRYDFLF